MCAGGWLGGGGEGLRLSLAPFAFLGDVLEPEGPPVPSLFLPPLPLPLPPCPVEVEVEAPLVFSFTLGIFLAKNAEKNWI